MGITKSVGTAYLFLYGWVQSPCTWQGCGGLWLVTSLNHPQRHTDCSSSNRWSSARIRVTINYPMQCFKVATLILHCHLSQFASLSCITLIGRKVDISWCFSAYWFHLSLFGDFPIRGMLFNCSHTHTHTHVSWPELDRVFTKGDGVQKWSRRRQRERRLHRL